MNPGARPPGASDEVQSARWVRRMFSSIAPRYDLANRVLSLGIDRSWRNALVRKVTSAAPGRDGLFLDLCCGTGDVLFDLGKHVAGSVLGADFSHEMLRVANRKAHRKRATAMLIEADALRLPLADGTLDGVTIAFGFRNLTSYRGGLEEMHRVLKPGGVAAILEFSHPRSRILRGAYAVYSKLLLPATGWLIAGSWQAYAYLPDSIKKFPRAEELRGMMEATGFEATEFRLLTGGIAALHTGRKSMRR